jgi:hypothetical protein
MTTNCKNCGAPLQLSENERIIQCEFCGTNNPVFPELQIAFRKPPKDPGEIQSVLDFYEEQEVGLKKMQAKFYHESNQLAEKMKKARTFQRDLLATVIVFFLMFILLVILAFIGSVRGEVALLAGLPFMFLALAIGEATEQIQSSKKKYLEHRKKHYDELKFIQIQLRKLATEEERLLAALSPEEK